MIRLQFSAADDPASEAIRIYSRGWPSHVDAVLSDGSLLGARADRLMGVPEGVQVRPPGYAAWSRTERVLLDVPPSVEVKFYDFLRQQLGKPYDKLAIAAFALQRDWHDQNAWFCSELIAAGLEVCGFFPKPLAFAANEVTPRDLLLCVSPWMA